MPAAIAIPLITAAASGTAAVIGSKINSNASDRAGQRQAEATDKATQIAQEQETERRREYDQQQAELKRQWDVTEANKAPYRQVSSDALFRVRDLLGLPQGAPMANGSAGASASGPTGAVPARPNDLGQALTQANAIAYGSEKHTDPNYWQALWSKDPDYAWKRMLGWQAGASDAATRGPYAGAGVAPRSASISAAVMPPAGMLASSSGPATDPNYTPVIPFSQLMRGVR